MRKILVAVGGILGLGAHGLWPSSPGGAPPAESAAAPYALVLGIAQDAGVPQIAAQGAEDRAARADRSRRRLVASLLVVDPAAGERWLIDATPDLAEQVERAAGHPASRRPGPGRPPLFEAIFLTHAHMGHYTGLLQLGREAYAAEGQRVVASPRMAEFLERNAPWELLLRLGHVRLERLDPARPLRLSDRLTIEALPVPHRAEYTDTVAYRIAGPRRALLWLPDIDKWPLWSRPLEEVLAGVDRAYLDGSFFGPEEVPGRSMAEIPHPFMVETLERLAPLPERERRKVVFVHLNHSNPALDPASPERARLERAGVRVAEELERFDL